MVLTTVWQSMAGREHAWRARGSSWLLYKSLLLARVLSLTPCCEGSVLTSLWLSCGLMGNRQPQAVC